MCLYTNECVWQYTLYHTFTIKFLLNNSPLFDCHWVLKKGDLNNIVSHCVCVRENILVMDIFFEALNYEKIEQKKAYELAGLLGETNHPSTESHWKELLLGQPAMMPKVYLLIWTETHKGILRKLCQAVRPLSQHATFTIIHHPHPVQEKRPHAPIGSLFPIYGTVCGWSIPHTNRQAQIKDLKTHIDWVIMNSSISLTTRQW